MGVALSEPLRAGGGQPHLRAREMVEPAIQLGRQVACCVSVPSLRLCTLHTPAGPTSASAMRTTPGGSARQLLARCVDCATEGGAVSKSGGWATSRKR